MRQGRLGLAAMTLALLGAALSARAAERERTPEGRGAAPDAQMLLDLDLLKEVDLGRERDFLKRLRLLERIRLLERWTLFESGPERVPTEGRERAPGKGGGR